MNPAQNGALLTEDDWSSYLTHALNNPVSVSFGRARRQVVQSQGFWKDPSGKPIKVRLARFFEGAPPDVQSALAKWLQYGRKAKLAASLLDAFIEESLRLAPPKKPRSATTESQGSTHDLAPLVSALIKGPNAEFQPLDFAPRGIPVITWGRRGQSHARHSLQLGSYAEDSHCIRLHRVLDQASVPTFFLRYVLFHELLHAARSTAAERAEQKHASRLHHDRAFREREKRYPDFQKANSWQAAWITALLRSARSGKPLVKTKTGLFGR